VIIQCTQCKTCFNIDPLLLERPKLRLRCSNCKHIFSFDQHTQTEAYQNRSQNNQITLGHIITFCNQKGGVAKTTSCLNIGIALSRLKYRVLCIDFDPQANLSLLVGHNTNAGSFYDAIISNGNLLQFTHKMPVGVWLLPSNQRMNLFPKYSLQTKNSEQLLYKTIQPLRKQFDFILIDTPPSLKFFTLNALIASDCVVITTQCAYLAMHGVEQIERVIDKIRVRLGKPKASKLLLTLYDPNSTAMQAVKGTLEQRYPKQIISPAIPFDTAIPEAQILRTAILDHAPQSAASQTYLTVAKKLVAEYCQ